MSLVSLRASAPLPSTDSTDPVARKTAATEARKELGRRVANIRRALDGLQPADYPSVASLVNAREELEGALDRAVKEANAAAEMEAALAEEVEAAQLEKTVADEEPAVAEAEAARASFDALCREAGAKLAEALALVREKDARRDSVRHALREAGKVPTRDAPLSLARDWLGILSAAQHKEGAEAAFLVAAALTAWSAPGAVAQREAEERERQRRKAAEAERRALDGLEGRAAQDAAAARHREGLKAAYPGFGGGALAAGARGTPAEVALYLQNAALNGTRVQE